MPVGSKHLRNGILKQHAFVDSKLPSKNLFIDFVLQKFVLVKSVADQQSRITQVALDIGIRFAERQTNIRIICSAAFIGHHGIRQPEKCFLILIGRGSCGNAIENNALFVPRKKPRNLVKYGQHLGTILCTDLHDIVPIKLQNIPLFLIGFSEVLMSFQKGNHTHWHAADQQILPPQKHRFVVQASFERLPLIKAGTDIAYQRLFLQSPAKFLEVQRIHLDMPLLGWNDNILYILLNGD